jgi:hypothetical protein
LELINQLRAISKRKRKAMNRTFLSCRSDEDADHPGRYGLIGS